MASPSLGGKEKRVKAGKPQLLLVEHQREDGSWVYKGVFKGYRD